MLRLGVLVSGGGTNLQAIIDRIEDKTITNAEIAVVISNNQGAYALERAKTHGIQAECISPKDFADREEFHKALLKELQKNKVESCGSCRISGCDSTGDRGSISQQDHQYSSISDPVFLRNVGFYGLKVHEGVLGQRGKGDRGYGTFCGHRHRHRTDYSSEGCGSPEWRYSTDPSDKESWKKQNGRSFRRRLI